MIKAASLTKAYESREVLRGITFEAFPGQITLLVGPNGAGKSTIMKLLSGLARPHSGEAFINGFSLQRRKTAAQASLSFLPQTPSFHPRFSCAQIVRFYAQLRGLDPRERSNAMLNLVGLGGAARVHTGALSGGMRQRLGLALLFLPNAPVLLLDEPGISLDAEWRLRMQRLLREQADAGKAILITTHLLAEWNGVADRCLVCRDGLITGELNPAHLRDEATLDAAQLPGESLPFTSRHLQAVASHG